MEESTRTADWAPGTLEKTRKNLGELSKSEAAEMAKKLGGEIMYEKSAPNTLVNTNKSKGAIVRSSPSSSSQSKDSKTSVSSGSSSAGSMDKDEKSPQILGLPVVSKKISNQIDKIMMSPEYKIKQNYGVFNFVRSLQKNGTERVNPEWINFTIKQQIEHMEGFITVIKTIIQKAPSTYKTKIASVNEPKFKFLKMIAGWSMQKIKLCYVNLQSINEPIVVSDLIPIIQAFYRPLLTIYYYGSNQIPRLIKEIVSDINSYPDSNKDIFNNLGKQAVSGWLYIDGQIIKRSYPLLMRMCTNTYEHYSTFFSSKIADILKFVGLHKFDLLLMDAPKEQVKEAPKPKTAAPPQKGIKDSTVEAGLKLLDQLFPDAGFNKLESHPDLYPYFQPLYNFEEGFNMLSPENPVQLIVVLHRIIEDCLQGCRNIKFPETEDTKKGQDTIFTVFEQWSAYREEHFDQLYCEPLKELVNSSYSQPDFDKTHIGKRLITSLLWQVTYHFMPNFKFDQLILEHPVNDSELKPLFHRTDFARKYLTLVVNECNSKAQTKGKTRLIENPWEHYHFEVRNEVSKRLDVLLGAQNRSATTSATNANLLKYTLCFIAVLDWVINNPDSPAYDSNPMHIYRVSVEDGKPLFTVEERHDQNKLFSEAIKANYKKKAN